MIVLTQVLPVLVLVLKDRTGSIKILDSMDNIDNVNGMDIMYCQQ